MKKILTLVAALSLVAALAVGGSIAYLTDTEAATNVMTVGKVDIKLLEEQRSNGNDSDLTTFKSGTMLLPIVGSVQGEKDMWGMPKTETAANFMDKIVRVKNDGNTDAWVRVFVAKPKAFSDLAGDGNGNTSDDALHTSLGNRFDATKQGRYNVGADVWKSDAAWDWYSAYEANKEQGTPADFEIEIDGEIYVVSEYVRQKKLPAGETTDALLAGAYLDSHVDWDEDVNKYVYRFTDKAPVYIDFDVTNGVVIPVMVQAVQADGFATPYEAFKAAFGTSDEVKASLQRSFSNKTQPKIATPETAQAMIEAAVEGDTIYLSAGKYDELVIKSADGKEKNNLTIVGYEGAEVGFINLYNSDNITLDGITFDAAKAQRGLNKFKREDWMYASIADAAKLSDGSITLGESYNTVIKNCKFIGVASESDDYAPIHFVTDSGANNHKSANLTVENCTFDTNAVYYVYTYYFGQGFTKIMNNAFGSDDTYAWAPLYLGCSEAETTISGNTFNGWRVDGGYAVGLTSNNPSAAKAIEISDNTFNAPAGATKVVYNKNYPAASITYSNNTGLTL